MAEYDGPVLDAHHHLWRYGMGRHGWIAEGSGEGARWTPMGDLAALQRDFLPADYLAASAGQNIAATVHVEGGWRGGPPGEETAWLDGFDRRVVARRHVFHVDLAAADAARRIAGEAAHPRAAGVRDILAAGTEPGRGFAADGRMADPAWRRGLEAVFGHGLLFEVMIFPWQMAEAAGLAAGFPQGRFVLNHCGSPVDRSAEGMAAWASGLDALAACPNMWIKISNPFAYDHSWDLESLRTVVMRCLDAFGPSRALFGTDYPVAGLHASFEAMMRAYRTLLADLAPDEQRAFFHDTAAGLYGIAQEARP